MEALSCEHVSDSYEEYELINGEAYMMARQSVKHMRIEGNIFGRFDRFLRGKKCTALFEVDVHLGEGDDVIPDVMIVCNPDIITDRRVEGTPDLIVEVLSKSTGKKDRREKLETYAKYGVKEYWIVDPLNKSVEVYLQYEGRLVLARIHYCYSDKELSYMNDKEKSAAETQNSIKISLYDDFIVDVRDVFENVE